MSVNIAVVGGGSSYTPELFANLADFAERFEVAQVTLMDPNPSKLDFVADVCKRLIAENNL